MRAQPHAHPLSPRQRVAQKGHAVLRCLLERSVTTAVYTQPILHGWIEPAFTIEFVDRVTAEMAHSHRVPVLISAFEAIRLAGECVVAADVALVSQHTSSVAIETEGRPDTLDDVCVTLDAVSLTAEALARATVTPFYGIGVASWDRQANQGPIVVLEDAAALAQPLSERFHDLGRAWFILSALPCPSHVLLVPRQLLAEQREAVRSLVAVLQAARELARARLPTLSERLAREHAVHPGRLDALLVDQAYRITEHARAGWRELFRRTNYDLRLPELEQLEIVSLS
jgi:hypothetical protein